MLTAFNFHESIKAWPDNLSCPPRSARNLKVGSSQANLLIEYLSAGTDSTSAVNKGLDAKRRLLLAGPSVVPDLEARLLSGRWDDKVKCYSLLVEMGERVVEALEQHLADKPPTVILWDSGVLHELNRPASETVLRELLRNPSFYVRHLSALVLAFRRVATPIDAEWLLTELIDALHSDALVEGSAFTVAGGSLALLNHIAGRSFLPDGRPIEIYNLTWMFPPPVLPFPLAAPSFDSASRVEIIRTVETWLAAHRRTAR
jgi:hypothetical protein